MILPAIHYSRDPLEILIEKERHETPCKGCKHADSMMAFGKTVEVCKKGRNKRNAKCYEETFGPSCQGGK